MRILLISFLFLLVGCASYPTKNGFSPAQKIEQNATNPYFSDSTRDYVYKAQIKAFDNNFGGILAIKKLGTAHHRLVFTTEMGNTMFDFTFKGDEFKVNKILDKLNRKILINILKRDFLALILENPKIEETYQKKTKMLRKGSILGKKHYYLSKNGQLSKIIRTSNKKEKVMFSFVEINDDIAESIKIIHQNIKLKITLKAI